MPDSATAESPPSSAPASLRERRKQKARFDIARAALSLVKEKGYEATTVSEIAEAAAYSERSFYRYFTSKEDVIFFEVGHMLDEVRAAISEMAAGASLWDVVRGGVLASIERFQEPGGGFASDVLRTWMIDPALAGPFFRFCNRWHEVLAAGWSNAHGTGNPDTDLNAQLVAHYVTSTCQACFRVHLQSDEDLGKLLTTAFDQLEASLTAAGLLERS